MRTTVKFFGLALTLIALGLLPAIRTHAQEDGHPALFGTWMETLKSTDNSFPPFQTLITYTIDGGMLGTASIDSTPATLSGPTHGAWIYAGGRGFRWTGRAFSYDPQGNPNGIYVINEGIALNEKGDSYTGSGTFKIVNNGVTVFSGGYTLTAARVIVQ